MAIPPGPTRAIRTAKMADSPTWVKKGVIFAPQGDLPWMRTHAQIPTDDLLADGTVRIYFGTRDADNRTSTGVLDAAADEPGRVLRVEGRPVLSPGPLGCFDDCGAMPSCVVTRGTTKYLYYIGWNRRTTVPYQNAIGVAVSGAGDSSFRRLFDGPILERNRDEPHFVVTPFVLAQGERWHMWYCGCTEWTVVDGRPEPRYQIKYASSRDGIDWSPRGTVCIDYRTDDEANTRPCVLYEGGRYRMWYCYRSIRAYRTDPAKGYRLGYAESADGVRWERLDDRAGLGRSAEGWDSEMIAYPYVYRHGGRLFLLYNGNGFGKTGFGYAVAEAGG